MILDWEAPLEEGMAIHSSILAWRIPWTEEPGGYSPQSHKGSDTTEQLTLPLSLSFLSKEPYSTLDVGPGFKPRQNIKGINSSMAQPSTDWRGDTLPTEVMFPNMIGF